MKRKRKNQNIDSLIQGIETITKSQCSLSEMEVSLLNDAIAKLNGLRKKKGLTDKHYQLEIAEIVDLLYQYLI